MGTYESRFDVPEPTPSMLDRLRQPVAWAKDRLAFSAAASLLSAKGEVHEELPGGGYLDAGYSTVGDRDYVVSRVHFGDPQTEYSTNITISFDEDRMRIAKIRATSGTYDHHGGTIEERTYETGRLSNSLSVSHVNRLLNLTRQKIVAERQAAESN